jgi:hypothetical protein
VRMVGEGGGLEENGLSFGKQTQFVTSVDVDTVVLYGTLSVPTARNLCQLSGRV